MTTIRHNHSASLASPIDVVGTNSLLRVSQNKCRVYMTRLYFSVHYKVFYAGLILISLCSLAWLAVQFNAHAPEWRQISLEAALSLALVGDIAWRATIQTAFFKDLKNWPDLLVSALCLSVMTASFILPAAYETVDEVPALSLFIGRTVAQLLKLVILMKNTHRSESSVIELNDMSDAGQSEEKPGILILDKPIDDPSREMLNQNHDQSV